MVWLWILFICHLRLLDAFPAFLREKWTLEECLGDDTWFSYSVPEKCRISDYSGRLLPVLFPHFAAMLGSTADTNSSQSTELLEKLTQLLRD